jgi:hypothetical protein
MYTSTLLSLLLSSLTLTLATPLSLTLRNPDSNCPSGPYFCRSFDGFPAVVSSSSGNFFLRRIERQARLMNVSYIKVIAR